MEEILKTTQYLGVGTDPFETFNASSIIKVTAEGHGLEENYTIKISGSTAFNGVPESKINNYHQVYNVVDEDTFEIVIDTLDGFDPAVITAGTGGGDSVTITKQDFNEEGFREWLIQNTFEGWHPSGTCKMGKSDDSLAVVDTRCRVYGIKALRVCDASVFPTCPDGNTQAPCYAVAQRLSDLVKCEYKNLLHNC